MGRVCAFVVIREFVDAFVAIRGCIREFVDKFVDTFVNSWLHSWIHSWINSWTVCPVVPYIARGGEGDRPRIGARIHEWGGCAHSWLFVNSWIHSWLFVDAFVNSWIHS